jgi:hypothetical protein
MQLVLQVAAGPAQGEKFQLRQGQVAKVGRTEWADFGVPQDPTMSELHFAVQCGPAECQVFDLQSSSPTLVNGKPIQQAVLRTGDQITAGETCFAVQIFGQGLPVVEGHVNDAASSQPSAGALAPAETVGPVTAAEWCEWLGLSKAASSLAQQITCPRELLDRLVADALFADAICLLSALLPRAAAVAWAADSVRPYTSDNNLSDQQALQAAEQWSQDPQEPNRRAAETAATATNFEGAASWVALAAFWSGGSIAPPDQPVVEPLPTLTAKAVTGALLLAATNGPPSEANPRFQRFLELGTIRLV